MVTVYWGIVLLLFVLSFVGLFFPIIPSVLVLWVGFLLFHFAINPEELSTLFWATMLILTSFLMVSDFMTNRFFVDKLGGSKWGKRISVVGVVVGSFVIPPFGLFIVPFLAVLLVEQVQGNTMKESAVIALGSLFGFLSSTIAKLIIQLSMIVLFFLIIWI
jgi:uncharacterized protein